MQTINELQLINFTGLLLLGVVFGLPHSFVRALLALPFVMFFPGYAMVAALYPRRHDLESVERLALSIGLSLAIVPIVALVLNFVLSGIHSGPVLISLAGFTAACSLLAARARGRFPGPERFGIEIIPLLVHARRPSRSQMFLTAVAIMSIGLIGWRVYSASSSVKETFTEFYVLGLSGEIGHYPTQTIAGQPIKVTVGITSHELQRTEYEITIRAQGRTLATLGPITLNDEQRWETNATFTLSRRSDGEEVQFFLFKQGNASPYRFLHLWIRVV